MRILTEYFYIIAPIIGFLLWFIVFLVMRAKSENPANGYNVLGALLAGPIHFYLRGRKYTLTRRELIGWLLVFCLIVAAPFIAALLERS